MQVVTMKKPKSSYFVRTTNSPCTTLSSLHHHFCGWILQMWMDDNKAKYQAENPGAKMVELTKLMGAGWKALSEQEKQVRK